MSGNIQRIVNHITAPTMAALMTIFTSSMMVRIEKMRFKPAIGLAFWMLGTTGLVAIWKPTCGMSAATPAAAATATQGTTTSRVAPPIL